MVYGRSLPAATPKVLGVHRVSHMRDMRYGPFLLRHYELLVHVSPGFYAHI